MGHLSLTPSLPRCYPQVFSGDADDTLVDTQEERLLRMWLNSLDPRISLLTLFDKALQTVSVCGWAIVWMGHGVDGL